MTMRARLLFPVLALLALVAAPARAAGPPHKVVVGTYLNHVYSLDIKGSQFAIDFYVWFRWEGDDIKPMDNFELPNGRITSKTGCQKKKLGTENYSNCRILATMTKFWDLRRFPLDAHALTLEIEDSVDDERTLVYELDKENTGISPTLEVPGWIIKKSAAGTEHQTYHTNYGDTSLPSNTESRYARYVYSIDVARPGYGRFLKVFFGLFISVLISWCGFFVRPKESSPRVSLGVGATFAAAAVTVAINNSLPDTNAVTMADKLIMLTLGIIVAAVAETITALTLFARGHEDTQKKLDKICSFAFPAFYLIALILIVS